MVSLTVTFIVKIGAGLRGAQNALSLTPGVAVSHAHLPCVYHQPDCCLRFRRVPFVKGKAHQKGSTKILFDYWAATCIWRRKLCVN